MQVTYQVMDFSVDLSRVVIGGKYLKAAPDITAAGLLIYATE